MVDVNVDMLAKNGAKGDTSILRSHTHINGYKRDSTGIPLLQSASALNPFEAGPTVALPVDAGGAHSDPAPGTTLTDRSLKSG